LVVDHAEKTRPGGKKTQLILSLGGKKGGRKKKRTANGHIAAGCRERREEKNKSRRRRKGPTFPVFLPAGRQMGEREQSWAQQQPKSWERLDKKREKKQSPIISAGLVGKKGGTGPHGHRMIRSRKGLPKKGRGKLPALYNGPRKKEKKRNGARELPPDSKRGKGLGKKKPLLPRRPKTKGKKSRIGP